MIQTIPLIFQMIEVLPTQIVFQSRDRLLQVADVRQSFDGLFQVVDVSSESGETYNVTRFGDFYYSCTCRAKKLCRHIRVVYPALCIKCFGVPVTIHGDKCDQCTERHSPYLKRESGKKTTLIGRIRV